MNELNPCPFCGNKDVEMRFESGASFVYCESCETCGPNSEVVTAAWKAWNMRGDPAHDAIVNWLEWAKKAVEDENYEAWPSMHDLCVSISIAEHYLETVNND